MSKPYISVVFFYHVLHRSSCFPYIYFAAFTWNFVYNTVLFAKTVADQVDGFLQHLNNQQPTIRFIMETEKDNNIPFLDTSVIRDSNVLLTTSVYRKPTHTDQYLAYDSHHPQSVKRGIVKCLYDRSKHLITTPSVISKEKKHLSSVLVSNGYPSSFIRKLTKTTRPTANNEPTQDFLSFFPYGFFWSRFELLFQVLSTNLIFLTERKLIVTLLNCFS